MEIKLNLATKPYLNRQSIRLWLLVAAVVLALLLALNCSYGYQNYRQLSVLESRFQELTGQAAGMPGATAGYSPEKYAAVRSEIALENEIVAADQFRWTTLLGRFEELVPPEVRIVSIQPNFQGQSVQLACVARNLSAMTQFVDNLLTSEDLNQAYLKRHGEVESGTGGRKQVQIGFSVLIKEAF